MRRILVRADDLGFSRGVNYGIADSIKNGIIRSVGLMPNMPDAQHGVDLLAGVSVCMGQHTNICLGKPLTDPKLIPSLCQENGEFKSSRTYRDAYKQGKEFVVLDEVILEIEAQYQRFKELTGGEPHYFEGHAVVSDNFFKGLRIVAERHDLPYLDLNFTGGPMAFRSSKLYMCMESSRPDYDPLASMQRAALQDHGPDGVPMFVCHPGYLDDYLLRVSSLTTPRAQEVAMATSPATKVWLEENNISVVTYDEL